MWAGLSSVATATAAAASNAVGGGSPATADDREQREHRSATPTAGYKRRARPKLQQTYSSNRSSPEPSPERTRLRPFTPAQGSQQPHVRQRSPAATSALSGTAAAVFDATNPTRPSGQYNYETPGTEKGAYFGSNESERDTSNYDEYGDASSSEDSATELQDALKGLDSPQNIDDPGQMDGGGSTAHLVGNGGIRRELLVQRRVQEPSQHFGRAAWDQWEQALTKSRRSPALRVQEGTTGSPRRPRSLTPNVNATSLASRRRASPSSGALAQDIAALSSSHNRSPTLTAPASPAGNVPCQSKIPFRTDLLFEVAILTGSLILTAYRMVRLQTPLNADLQPLTPIPLSPLVLLIIAIPCTSLFRRMSWQSNYMFPFTDERGYRSPATVDDGFAAGAAVPVLLAAGFLWDAVSRGEEGMGYLGSITPLMDVWQAAGKSPLAATTPDLGAVYRTVVVARISLLLSTSINSFVLILNIVLSRTFLAVEKVPKDNTKRLLGSLIVSGTISLFLWTLLALNDAFAWASPYISPAEAAISSFIYQMSLYTISRLVRRGFTLGELSLATGSGISLALEFWRLSLTRLSYSRKGVIPPTFRMPTPLLPYQHVMIPGAFLTGFLLSPLLVLSRQFAQMPSHRLRRPEERGRNRKLAALGVGLGLIFVVFVPFGGWAGWALGGNLWTAWAWAARFSIFGGNGVEGMHGEYSGWKRWRRIALVLYWLGIATIAVGGWQTRIVRARRIRLAKNRNLLKPAENGNHSTKSNTLGVAGISELREDRRMHVALDLRRKFFHALAVLMFIPAIVIDPAFTSLAFSAAFAIFTFAEYARYFAVYPVGAPIHIFFNEFIDSKDAGPVILSHFYLLTGCAGGLWLEGQGIKSFTGVLSVGIGDAFASILGKRLGTTKWPHSNKTILGTAAFVLSVFGSALLLRITGLVEPFSIPKYLLATTAAGVLEAISAQNDNLVIPIFFWSLLSLLEV